MVIRLIEIIEKLLARLINFYSFYPCLRNSLVINLFLLGLPPFAKIHTRLFQIKLQFYVILNSYITLTLYILQYVLNSLTFNRSPRATEKKKTATLLRTFQFVSVLFYFTSRLILSSRDKLESLIVDRNVERKCELRFI